MWSVLVDGRGGSKGEVLALEDVLEMDWEDGGWNFLV